jgi:hypothetical protein
MARLLESEERPRAMLTTGMTMNLNESNIFIQKIASGLQKKELLGNKNYLIATVITKNTQKTLFFLQPPKKMNVSDCKKLFRKNEKTAA